MLLPTPTQPWSHLSVDCITDLPECQEKSIIMTVVNQFSKRLRLMVLSTQLSLFSNVLLLGIPEDIMSERTQFMS